MAFFSTVGNEAQYQKYDNTDSGLAATNTQDAIDEIDSTVDGLVDDAVQIDTDQVLNGFTLLAEYPPTASPIFWFESTVPNPATGSDGDYAFRGDDSTVYEKVSGSWVLVSNGVLLTGLWPVDPPAPGYPAGSSSLPALIAANPYPVSHVIVVNPPGFTPPVTNQSNIRALFSADYTVPVTAGDIIRWDGMAQEWAVEAHTAGIVSYDNTTSGLTATDVQAAIDEVYAALDEAGEIDYDNSTSGLTATDVQAAIDEVYAAHDEASEISYDNSTSGLTATDVQAAIDEVYSAHDEASEISYDNSTSGLTATDVQAAIDEVYAAHDEASEISYDGSTSGLSATDVQAAIDEVVAEQFTVTPRTWEALDWATLATGAAAPTSADGSPGWYWFDTTAEELYGPAVFDNTIPGMDWGTALANVVFSTTGPTNEAGDWYVWDDSGTYILFQKKTTINYNDLIRAQSGGTWEAVSNKINATEVHVDLSAVESTFGVKNVRTELLNLEVFTAKPSGGLWSDKIVEDISGTYEAQVGYANNFLLTLVDDTTFNLPTDMNAQMYYSEGLANKSSEISVILKQGDGGPHTLTWGTMIELPTGGLTLTPHADEADWFKFITFDNGTTWLASRIGTRYFQ